MSSSNIWNHTSLKPTRTSSPLNQSLRPTLQNHTSTGRMTSSTASTTMATSAACREQRPQHLYAILLFQLPYQALSLLSTSNTSHRTLQPSTTDCILISALIRTPLPPRPLHHPDHILRDSHAALRSLHSHFTIRNRPFSLHPVRSVMHLVFLNCLLHPPQTTSRSKSTIARNMPLS